MQQGKGAELGSGFGRGAAGGLFSGGGGGANFLTRTTAALATIFFVTALLLTLIQSNRPEEGVIEQLRAEEIIAPGGGTAGESSAELPAESNSESGGASQIPE